MTPGAERAARAAAKRVAATPPDVKAILAEGRRRRAELTAQGRDTAALAMVQAAVLRRLAMIEHTVSPAVRARHLGTLADWLASDEMRALFARAADLPRRPRLLHPRPARVERPVEVPAWVPDDLADGYLDIAHTCGEEAAAASVRRLKREASA